MRVACVGLTFLVALPAAASEPGEPLDASDWVIVLPGISASMVLPRIDSTVCDDPAMKPDLRCKGYLGGSTMGPRGFHYYFLELNVPNCAQQGVFNCNRYEYWRASPTGSTELIAYIEGRPGQIDTPIGTETIVDDVIANVHSIDFANGELRILMETHAEMAVIQEYYPYNPGKSVIRLSGFDTLSDVLQTYTPTGPVSNGRSIIDANRASKR